MRLVSFKTFATAITLCVCVLMGLSAPDTQTTESVIPAAALQACEQMNAGEALTLEEKALIEAYCPSTEQSEEEQRRSSLDNNGGAFFVYSGSALRIPPTGNGGGAGDSTVAAISVSGLSGPIADVQVTIDSLRHTWDSDLIFTLQSPSGTALTLINHRGGSADNFFRTHLSDSAFIPIGSGSAPFTGDFRPDQPLSMFDGQSPNGNWRLRIMDGFAGDSGWVYSWRIQILVGTPPPCYDSTVTAPGAFIGNTCGAGYDCGLRPSEEQVWRVVIPADGEWTFSLCGSANWDPYLFIAGECCNGVIAFDDDGCGQSLESIIPCLSLVAGTYYAIIESYYSNSCGIYTLQIAPCAPPCLPPEGLTIQRIGADAFLCWRPVISALQYQIYSSPTPDGNFNILATVEDTSFTDVNPYGTAKQFYYVAAECP
jgi:subtilisin-like proprotein convertase family protein